MGKYRVNEKPRQSVVPVLESVPGQSCLVQWVGIYDNHSVLHLSGGRDINMWAESDRFPPVKRPKTLSDCSDDYLAKIAARGIPIEELRELRSLEQQYRTRQTATSS